MPSTTAPEPPQPWPAWMEAQHRTFLAQMVDRPATSAWIGVVSPDWLEGKNEARVPRRDGRLVSFPDEPVAEVFVWETTRDSWAPELWVAPGREDHRDLYAKFLSIYWPGSDINEVPNHVDHVFPKRAAELGELSHVRLLAIPTRSNVSAGTLEYKMKERNVEMGARVTPVRFATLYALGKATGYVGYSGLKTEEGRRKIAAGILENLRAVGAPKEITASGIDEELLAQRLADLR